MRKHMMIKTAARTLLVTLGLVILSAEPGHGQLPDNVMNAHFIDVGQGDATLLEFSCGLVLIDAGGQANSDSDALVQYLRTVFASRPDLSETIETVFITHNHVDHTRSVDEVLAAFTVRHVVENGMRGSSRDPGDATLRRMESDMAAGRLTLTHLDVDDADVVADFGLATVEIDPVECAGTNPTITVLSADLAEDPGWGSSEFRDKNNHSLVIRVDFGAASFLFTGDLEEPAIETLVVFYEDTPMLDADVYQVGHHGSHNGTTWSLLNALVEPRIAVISMGRCDRRAGLFNAFQFGHPRRDVVRMLQAAIRQRRNPSKRVLVADGVRDFRRIRMRDAIYATGWDGTIVIRATSAGDYQVTPGDASEPSC